MEPTVLFALFLVRRMKELLAAPFSQVTRNRLLSPDRISVITLPLSLLAVGVAGATSEDIVAAPEMSGGTVALFGMPLLVVALAIGLVVSWRRAEAALGRMATIERVEKERAEIAVKRDREHRALLESHHRLLESDPTGVVALDEKLRVTYMNPSIRHTLGTPRGENYDVLGRDITSVSSVMSAGLSQVIAQLSQGKSLTTEKPFVSIYGKKSYLQMTGEPIMDNDTFVGALLLLTDLSEQQIAAQATDRDKEMIKTLQRSAHIGSWEWGIHSGEMKWSEETFRIFGLTAESIRPTFDTFIELTHPDERQKTETTIKKAMTAGASYDFERRIVRPDGVERIVRDSGVIYRDDEDSPDLLVGYIEDITDRVHAAHALVEAEETDTLGHFAGSLASEIGASLDMVVSDIKRVFETLGQDVKGNASLRAALMTTLRASDLATRMIAFTGADQVTLTKTDIKKLIDELIPILGKDTPASVSVELALADCLPQINGNESQLKQLFMRFATHAAESIGDRAGEVIISGGVEEISVADLEEAVFCAHRNPGLYMVVEVRDVIKGGANEVGGGHTSYSSVSPTGSRLGLAVVEAIIRAHDGGLTVKNDKEQGSSFKVFFPIPPEELKKATIDRPPCVLVVDDEEAVRRVASRMLTKAGYDVVQANDGLEAVKAYQESSGKIDLVLMDLAMPNMDGFEAFKELRKLSTELKVILCSGYDHMDTLKKMKGEGLSGFIQKPYTRDELLPEIEAAIGVNK